MLTLGAIGDSYGFCFEFADPKFVAQHNDLKYIQHPEFVHITPGAYSDDTQMQLALAELIVSGLEWTPISIADQFVRSYKRDPRLGYARRFRALLEEVGDGSKLIATIQANSERNGAAMAIVPIMLGSYALRLLRSCAEYPAGLCTAGSSRTRTVGCQPPD